MASIVSQTYTTSTIFLNIPNRYFYLRLKEGYIISPCLPAPHPSFRIRPIEPKPIEPHPRGPQPRWGSSLESFILWNLSLESLGIWGLS